MSGEAGGESCKSPVLFATMANGIAINPMVWQYNQGLSGSLGIFPSFADFVGSIDFAHLTNPAEAVVTVGGATAYGMKCDQGAFGWINGGASGKSLGVAGVPNNAYAVTFYAGGIRPGNRALGTVHICRCGGTQVHNNHKVTGKSPRAQARSNALPQDYAIQTCLPEH
jgi:hypothetical protein